MENTLYSGQGGRKKLGVMESGKSGLSSGFLQESFRGYIDPRYNTLLSSPASKRRPKIITDPQNGMKHFATAYKKNEMTEAMKMSTPKPLSLRYPAQAIMGTPITSARASKKSLEYSSSLDVIRRKKSKTGVKNKVKGTSSPFSNSARSSPVQLESPKKPGSANSPGSKKLMSSKLTRSENINSAAANDIIKIIQETSGSKKKTRKKTKSSHEIGESEEVAEGSSSNPLLQLHLFPRNAKLENFFSTAASPLQESIFVNELDTENAQATKYVQEALKAWTNAPTGLRTVVSLCSDATEDVSGHSEVNEDGGGCDRRKSTDDTDRISDGLILSNNSTVASAMVPSVSSEKRLKRFRKRKKKAVALEDINSSDTFQSDAEEGIIRKIIMSKESLLEENADLNRNSREKEMPADAKGVSAENSTQTDVQDEPVAPLKHFLEAAVFTETKMATVSTSYTAFSTDDESRRGRSENRCRSRNIRSGSGRHRQSKENFTGTVDKKSFKAHPSPYDESSNDEGDDSSHDSALVGATGCPHEVKLLSCELEAEGKKVTLVQEGKHFSKAADVSFNVEQYERDLNFYSQHPTTLAYVEDGGKKSIGRRECADLGVKGNITGFVYPLIETKGSAFTEKTASRSGERIAYSNGQALDRRIPEGVSSSQQSAQLQDSRETFRACQTSDSLTDLDEEDGPEIFEGLTEAGIMQFSEDFVNTINDLELGSNFNKISDSAFTTFKAVKEMITDLVSRDNAESSVEGISADTEDAIIDGTSGSGVAAGVLEDADVIEIAKEVPEVDYYNGNAKERENRCAASIEAEDSEENKQVPEAQVEFANTNIEVSEVNIPEAPVKISEALDGSLEVSDEILGGAVIVSKTEPDAREDSVEISENDHDVTEDSAEISDTDVFEDPIEIPETEPDVTEDSVEISETEPVVLENCVKNLEGENSDNECNALECLPKTGSRKSVAENVEGI